MTRAGIFERVRVCFAMLGMLMWVGLANAQATRTWVSGVGDDANPCSRTAPCQTFAGAISKTAAGGEIDALDPGAFDFVVTNPGGVKTYTYTPLVITKPITIDGGWGHNADLGPMSPADPNDVTSATVMTSQQDAIVINVPSGSSGVILRNLHINGANGTGRNGVRIVSGSSVIIDNLDISQFSQNCLDIDTSASGTLVDIANSTFTNCVNGLLVNGGATVNFDNSISVLNSSTGLELTDPQGTLFSASSFVIDNLQNAGYTGPTPDLSGIPASVASAVIKGGTNPNCSFSSAQFISPPPISNGKPEQAGFQFNTNDCGAGATITITITYTQAMPPGTKLYKYNASNSSWSPVSGAVLSPDGKSFTYSITDNGNGDSNPALGFISDPVVPVSITNNPIPTLSDLGAVLLAGLLAFVGLCTLQSRRLQA